MTSITGFSNYDSEYFLDGDQRSLTGGLRFACEKQEASLDIINSDQGATEPTSNPLINLLANRVLGRVPGILDMERSTENWSPTLNLQWEFSDTGMAYARVSRGFKSGGFNPGAVDATRPDVYEFDARLITSPHLVLGLSMAYLKSEFDQFEDAGCAGAQRRLANPVPGCVNEVQDLSGRTTRNAPEWSATFTTNFFYPVGDNLEFRAALDVIYSDKFYFDQSLDSNLVQDSFTKVNGRLALASNADSWEVALIGKHLSNELTHATGANTTALPAPISPVCRRHARWRWRPAIGSERAAEHRPAPHNRGEVL